MTHLLQKSQRLNAKFTTLTILLPQEGTTHHPLLFSVIPAAHISCSVRQRLVFFWKLPVRCASNASRL